MPASRTIRKNIALVLGAGASMPYGFPSGAKLREILCALEFVALPERILLSQLATEPRAVAFSRAFRESGIASIDEFLERRQDLLDVGRHAIAMVVGQFEHSARLFSPKTDEGWYDYLWNRICGNSLEDVAQNRLRVITFNYDRSLEHYLYKAIVNTYNASPSDALSTLRQIQIIHVHGLLGEYRPPDMPDGNGRPYEPITDAEGLKYAGQSLKLVYERRDDAMLSAIHETLEWAKAIYVLGFGFDSRNCEILNLSRADTSPTQPKFVMATAYQMTEAEIGLARERLSSRRNAGMEKASILAFLRLTCFLDKAAEAQ